jgi:hypothetical protein
MAPGWQRGSAGHRVFGLDSAEVLHVPADTAAGVLPEPIHQRGEVNCVSRRLPVVIAIWIDRRLLSIDSAVGVDAEGEKVEGR